MARHVALLRAINVGSGRKVPMAELRELLEASGATDVATYVQSGNVALSSRKAPATLERELTAAVSERFGFAIDILVRTQAEFAAVAADDPFDGAASDPTKHLILFSREPLDVDQIARAAPRDLGDERWAVRGRELHLWLPGGAGRSRLATALSDRRLKIVATGRNRRTVEKLLRLLGD